MENCVHATQSGKMRSEPDLCVQCVLYLDPLFKWQFAHSPFGVTFSLFSALPIVTVGVAAAAALSRTLNLSTLLWMMRIFSLPVFFPFHFLLFQFFRVQRAMEIAGCILYSTTVRGVYVIIYLCIQTTELVSIHRFIRDSDSSRFVSSSSSRVLFLSPLLTFFRPMLSLILCVRLRHQHCLRTRRWTERTKSSSALHSSFNMYLREW